jgi:hypothetical protein
MVQPKSGVNTLEKMDGALVAPKSDITALIDGTTVAKKAEKDAEGNTIPTTYATKTELSAEATARTNADSNLQQQINQHDSRLSNLEQKAGDYVPVQYRGTNAVPTGKASYGLVEKIVGKTRAWNQLVKNGNFADGSTNWSVNGGSISVSNNECTVTGTGSIETYGTQLSQNVSTTVGHKYLVLCEMKCSNKTLNDVFPAFKFGNYGRLLTVVNTWESISTIYEAVSSSSEINPRTQSEDGIQGSFSLRNIIVRDLTTIFGSGNEPSTVADALTALPALGQYNAYDAGSLVSTTVEGVESVGVNIWDEEWESGDINVFDGQKRADSLRCRSKNFIEVKPLTTYYTKTEYPNTTICCYDADGNWVSSEYQTGYFSGQNTTFTTPSWCHKVMLYYNGTTYNHDIQICLNSYADKTTYHPYVHDTLSLPSVTLKSDDELTPETGGIVRKMVQVDLSDYDWTYSSSYWVMTSGTKKDSFTNIVKGFGGSYVPNWVSAKYEIVKGSEVVLGNKLYAIGQSSDKSMLCHNGSDTTPPSGTLIAELATPTTESVSPAPKNTIYTEGGGTINTVQTQTPVIDNCLDVGYLAV